MEPLATQNLTLIFPFFVMCVYLLHESESVTEVGPPGPFIWQDVLNANDQDIRMILNIICIVRQKPLL